jgi:hypothetical protein
VPLAVPCRPALRTVWADGGWQMACRGAPSFSRGGRFLSLARCHGQGPTTHACGPRSRIRADFHKALRCAPGILFKASTLPLVVLCQLPRFGPRKLARSWSTGWLECGNDFASWVRVRGLIKMRRAIIPSAPVLRVPTSKNNACHCHLQRTFPGTVLSCCCARPQEQ